MAGSCVCNPSAGTGSWKALWDLSATPLVQVQCETLSQENTEESARAGLAISSLNTHRQMPPLPSHVHTIHTTHKKYTLLPKNTETAPAGIFFPGLGDEDSTIRKKGQSFQQICLAW